MKQRALTLISEIQPSKLDDLRYILKLKNESLKSALHTIGTIHYCRWVIIEEKELDGKILLPQLAFSSNFDGEVDTHIQDLIKHLGMELDEIYSHCVGFSHADKFTYFKSIRVKEMAFYQGSPGRSLQTILNEKQLRNRLVELKNNTNWEGQSSFAVHHQMQKAIYEDSQFEWAKERVDVPGINWLGLILVGILLLALAPFVILWALYIQLFFEQFDKPLGLTRNDLDDEHITAMQMDEDYLFQNQFSQIIDMKPGLSRLITLNFLYFVTRLLIKVFFVKGELMGIPTIHFARWVMVNKNKRMLFFSNFDGNWTQYLGDFIDKSGWGLTGIFGNTATFPRSLFLIFKGAYNQQEFLAWSRNTQIPTQVWYVADPSLSIKNINNNTIIRNLLSKKLNEKQAAYFLSRI